MTTGTKATDSKLGQVQKAIGYWEVCLDDARDAACKEDECKQEIKGLRVMCLHCPAMDLCERCEMIASLDHPHEHVFRIITTPNEA
eukprot:m51a1_g12635 hypothetical protein (86) ;mRNA; f:269-658